MATKKKDNRECDQQLGTHVGADAAKVSDFRNLTGGDLIPTGGYSDQPFLVKADDGAWVLVVTSGAVHEGLAGQTVVAMRSTDFGKTWTDETLLEPTDGPETAYGVLLKTPYGRIYCFYNHNTDNVRSVETDRSGTYYRVDSLGHFVFRYTDDNGLTWSDRRYEVPIRATEIDLNNYHKGALKYFWNVGKGFVLNGKGYVPLSKIGEFGSPGGFVKSEGALLCSKNILSERDAEKIEWETLPEGMVGLRAPENAGSVAEEHSMVTLSDGTIFAVYRTVSGHSACSYSRDGGKNFSKPEFMRYADGRVIKNPRASNFIWKCKNGKYLYWFYNNGRKGYTDRNPVWVSGAIEKKTDGGMVLLFSQPEIVLYDDDPVLLIGYPDMIEDDGAYFITETQKRLARTHRIPSAFFDNVWAQFTSRKEIGGEYYEALTASQPFVQLPPFFVRDPGMTAGGSVPQRGGVSFVCDYENIQEGETLFSTLDAENRGVSLKFENDNFVFYMSDGRTQCVFNTAEDFISAEKGRLAVVADAGPNIVYFVYNGLFCDGGKNRAFGWQRFSPALQDANGGSYISLGKHVRRVRVFKHAVTVSECVIGR